MKIVNSIKPADYRVRRGTAFSLLALVMSALLLEFGPVAIDQAAHFHLQSIFDSHGFALWDNTWYLGRYSFVNYSFAFYLFGFLLGIKVVAVLSVAVSVGAMSMIADRVLAGTLSGFQRLPLLFFPFMVLTGAWPFLLGTAFFLLAFYFYLTGRRVLFAFFALWTLLASPLALLGLILAIVSGETPFALMFERKVLKALKLLFSSFYLYVVAILGLAELISMRIFPDHGFYPYWWTDLFLVEVFSAVCFLMVPGEFSHKVRLRFLIVIYGVLNLVAFELRSDLGSNAARIVDFAFPGVALLLVQRKFRPRFVSFLLLFLALVWNVLPIFQVIGTLGAPSSNGSYWSALKPALSRYVRPGSRVEVVDSVNHLGAYYLPKMGFPVVRGWFRQDDFPQNALLYSNSPLTSTEYRTWLEDSGASVVLLPQGPYDFSSQKEAELLSSGQSGLIQLASKNGVRLFAVPGSPTVVRSPDGAYINAKVGLENVEFYAPKPGIYRLSIFYSPYFVAANGSVCRNAEGMISWKVNRSGSNRLEFQLSVAKAVSVLFGHGVTNCG